jgi:hypothetical protein
MKTSLMRGGREAVSHHGKKKARVETAYKFEISRDNSAGGRQLECRGTLGSPVAIWTRSRYAPANLKIFTCIHAESALPL